MTVQVVDNKGDYEGTVTAVPPIAREWGFKVGDVKWKSVVLTGGQGYSNDLYMNSGRTGLGYKSTRIFVVSQDTIKTSLITYSGETIGRYQTWVRQNQLTTQVNSLFIE